ncbi:MAG: class I SAM-dependent methyltransferase [Gaiellaceae bacterium]
MHDELKARTAAVWSSAPWEQAQHFLASVHEHLIERLRPGPGERFLDVATGTGAIALRAARAGAEVTGVDIASGLVETARRLAREEGLDVGFDVGDAEQLPYPDASFDLVASSMGAIFTPSHRAAADELARVCRTGGRLGMSAWRPETGFFSITRKYAPPPEPGVDDSDEWSREEHAQELLGEGFELEFDEGDASMVAESGDAMFELLAESVGPFRATLEGLEPDRARAFRRELVGFLEAHREGDGEIRLPALYILILGRRR